MFVKLLKEVFYGWIALEFTVLYSSGATFTLGEEQILIYSSSLVGGGHQGGALFNLLFVQLMIKRVADGEDGESSSLSTFTPHDQLSPLQSEDI